MRTSIKQAAAVMLLLPCMAAVSLADDHGRDRDRDRHEGHRNEWRGDINRFHEHDINRWRGGRWHHGMHAGRSGWWWIVGGVWYFYPVRVLPYPDPYQPPIVIAPPATPAPPQYWYYCTSPTGYYPYIPQCQVTWQRVPATP